MAKTKPRPKKAASKKAAPKKAAKTKSKSVRKKAAENKKNKNKVVEAEVIDEPKGLPNLPTREEVIKALEELKEEPPQVTQPTEGILIAHWNGRFGNRMHQYAYGAEYSRKFGVDFILPADWEGTVLFKNQYHKVLEDDELRLHINQTQESLDTLPARTEAIKNFNNRTASSFVYLNPDNPNENWSEKKSVFIDSVCAYHPSIFEHMDAKWQIEEVFEFSDEVKNSDVYKRAEDKQGTYDIAHLRRDDVSNAEYNKSGKHPMGYSVLSKESYIKAFKKYGYDPEAMEWTSDDYSKKWHTDRAENQRGGWSYPVGASLMPDVFYDWFPDFLRIYFARTVFRANSSFSWWACFLSPSAKVYCPVQNKHIIYGRDAEEEVNVEFEEGNHTHWMYGNANIHDGYANYRKNKIKHDKDREIVDEIVTEVFNSS